MREGPEVLVVRTGTANLASVVAGLERADTRPRITSDAREVERASHVVLPGVGAFAAAMEELARQGLVDVLRARIEADRPTLCVCLGLQLLAEESEESPGVRGLGAFPIRARRFPSTVRVPQLGWNGIEPEPGCRFLGAGHAYFANSYHLDERPAEWRAAWAEHGVRFVAALERGSVLACQFHPELSGAFGRELLGSWLREGAPAC